MKAFIFDLDGVLVDTAKYHYLAWRRLAKELGFDFSEEHNEKLKGVSRMTSLEILLRVGGLCFSEEEKLKMAKRKNTWYVEYISGMTPDEILPGVVEFLDQTRASGLKTAIGSASKNTPMILKQTDLQKWFDAVIDGNHTSKAKPDPEVFLLGALQLKVKPSECVVFEDAEAGIEAALNAGMNCVGIGRPEILKRAGMVIPSLKFCSAGEIIHRFNM